MPAKTELNPEGNAKFGPGSGKDPVSEIPPVAILALGAVMKNGADKYGPFNWRENGVDLRTYYNAAMRHLMALWDGEIFDPDSKHPHAAHVMACMAIILDANALNLLDYNGPKVTGSRKVWTSESSIG